MFFDSLAPIAIAFFIVAVSPGPANIAVATVSMQFGRRNGLTFGLGLALGLAVWGVVAATGLGALLQSSIYMLTALKIIGGAYLIWLAVQSARSAIAPNKATIKVADQGRWFMRGLVLNLSNPKAVLAWMAALSMGLDAQTGNGFMPVVIATALCMIIGVFNYTGHALAFSLPGIMVAYQRLRRWVDASVAGLFALGGFGLIRSAFSRS